MCRAVINDDIKLCLIPILRTLIALTLMDGTGKWIFYVARHAYNQFIGQLYIMVVQYVLCVGLCLIL